MYSHQDLQIKDGHLWQSTRQRILFHLLFWIVYFSFQCGYEFWMTFMFHGDNYLALLITNLRPFILTALGYYFTIWVLQTRSWRIILLGAIMLMPIVYWGMYLFDLVEMKLHYHEGGRKDVFLKNIYQFRTTRIYSLDFLFNFLATVFWFSMLPFAVKFGVSCYESIQRQKKIVAENRNLQLKNVSQSLSLTWIKRNLTLLESSVSEFPVAKKAVQKLQYLLIFAFEKAQQKQVSLSEEVHFLSDYISFEQLRQKESRVDIQFDHQNVEEPAILIPPLLFVSFIENAFKHGINSTSEKAWTYIELSQKANMIFFSIENSLPLEADTGSTSLDLVGGIGLENIRKRLDIEFPQQYKLDISKTATFKVDLSIILS